MQYSGYSKKFRYEVVDSAVKAYRARQEAELKGERPMHRLCKFKCKCICNWPLPIGAFQDQCKQIVINKHNVVKNPN